MIGITLFALIPCGYVGWQAKIARERTGTRDDILRRGGIVHADVIDRTGTGRVYVSRLSWIRELLGDHAMEWIILPIGATLEEEERVKSLFPEAQVSHDSAG